MFTRQIKEEPIDDDYEEVISSSSRNRDRPTAEARRESLAFYQAIKESRREKNRIEKLRREKNRIERNRIKQEVLDASYEQHDTSTSAGSSSQPRPRDEVFEQNGYAHHLSTQAPENSVIPAASEPLSARDEEIRNIAACLRESAERYGPPPPPLQMSSSETIPEQSNQVWSSMSTETSNFEEPSSQNEGHELVQDDNNHGQDAVVEIRVTKETVDVNVEVDDGLIVLIESKACAKRRKRRAECEALKESMTYGEIAVLESIMEQEPVYENEERKTRKSRRLLKQNNPAPIRKVEQPPRKQRGRPRKAQVIQIDENENEPIRPEAPSDQPRCLVKLEPAASPPATTPSPILPSPVLSSPPLPSPPEHVECSVPVRTVKLEVCEPEPAMQPREHPAAESPEIPGSTPEFIDPSDEMATQEDEAFDFDFDLAELSIDSPLHCRRDSSPESIHNHTQPAPGPEGDHQEDQTMSSKRRNTNNSRCASLAIQITESPHLPPAPKRSIVVDSDDDDDEEMSGELSELSKRPRTPRPRYSPDSQRRTNSRLAMSALTIDTQRNSDLNADGSGPSSSNTCAMSTPDTERRLQRRKGPLSVTRQKRKSQTPLASQEESMDDSDDCEEEWENLPIVLDDPSFKLTKEQKDQFLEMKKKVTRTLEFDASELAEVYRNAKNEPARLPERIHIGKKVMQTWYGSPFPAEFINGRILYICDFCFFYGRSDLIMQNHAKKCTARAPPGTEIYRKDDISVFEVDGRIEKQYCQTLCLVSRMFLESKTVFYDTEPFFFYVATVNDGGAARFAGYFSKEKYDPDINNLACIMTLPCYQDKGLGRFLIDVSYALSLKEKWFGGPESPLSDLGKRSYGSYWKYAIATFLRDNKKIIENGPGISIGTIANGTGINHHDILDIVCVLEWAKPVDPNGDGVHILQWDVDWEHVEKIVSASANSSKIKFDPKKLDWKPRKMTPAMDGYHELTKREIEEDEKKRKSLPKTPILESMKIGTPTSTTSLPVGSVKKELRSRGHNRSVGRNLKNEINRKVKVPENADVLEITDEETKEDERRKLKKSKRSSMKCADFAPEKKGNREETPDDDVPGPSSKLNGKRQRINKNATEVATTSEQKPPSSGKGRPRNRSGKDQKEEVEETTDADPITSEDDVPFEKHAQKGKNGKVQRGKKMQKKRGSKQLSSNYGVRGDETEDEKLKMETELVDPQVPGTSNDAVMKKENAIRESDTPTTSNVVPDNKVEETKAGTDRDTEHEEPMDLEEELSRDYNIGTPESYHSTPPASPEPTLDEMIPPNIFNNSDQFEESDIAPPLLVSEVTNLSVEKPGESRVEDSSNAPPLALNANDAVGYSSGDDEAPPRLSPQFGKNEDNEEEAAPSIPAVHNGVHTEKPPQYLETSMNPGPSSSTIHMTPQMMSQNQQSMMTSTPQHPYSQPNSHQQTTPGSGGIPSCGPPAYSTPEQKQQQFMSPPMAGMPNSVSSVHSVHNNNSMEMVGGPSSLQHTPQQQPYDIGHGMQMPQDNGVMSNNVATIEHQNQIMMAQHGFNSPPRAANAVQPPQQLQQPQPPPPQPQPPQVAPVLPAPAVTNGRRRSESAATRKQRQRPTSAAQPPAHVPMPAHPMPIMQPMQAFYGYPYPGYPPMWGDNAALYHYNPYGYHNPMLNTIQQDAYQRNFLHNYNNGTIPDAATNGNVANQFPAPGNGQGNWFQQYNNLR